MATAAGTKPRRPSGAARNRVLESSARVDIPVKACEHAGFREWAVSADFPQTGRIFFLGENLFIDMSPEELEAHNKVKTEVSCKIHLLGRELDKGTFFSDRTLVSNKRAKLTTEPDGTFVTWESLREKRVRMVKRKGRPREVVELVGTPDWILEIVSRSSWKKDTEEMPVLYARAKVGEYWLIDALDEEVDFKVLLLKDGVYVPAPNHDGWWHSPLFGYRFRLIRRLNAVGLWDYILEMRKD